MGRPAAGFESGQQVLGAALLDDELGEPDRAARVVVDVDVLDVDADLAGVAEEARQLARVVGHRDEDRAGRARRAAVLAGDRRGAGVAAGQDLDEVGAGAGSGPRRPRSSGRRGRRAPPPAGRARRSALDSRICCHSAGSLAATRVTSRTPCPERARCSGGAAASRPATRTAARWGRCEIRATARSCSAGSISSGRGSALEHERLDQAHRARVAPRRGASPPTGGRRRGPRWRPAGRSARCRPSGGSRRSAPGRSRRTRSATAASGAALTLPTSVTTASVRPSASTTAPAIVRGRHGHHDQLRPVGRRRGASGAEPGGRADVLGRRVAQHDVEPEAAAHERDRRADEARPDDLDRAGEGRQVRPQSWLVVRLRSRRRLAAPCR